MFQGSTFRPSAAEGFMPQVRLAGTQLIRSERAQGFYPIVSLGQDTQPAHVWHDRVMDALERYESLKCSIAITDETAREEITAWLGSPDTPGAPEYLYARVKEDSSSFAREGVSAYNDESRQARLTELEAVNGQFNAKVVEAVIQAHGKLPETTTSGAASTDQASDLTVPALIGTGAITLALLLS